MRIVAIHHPPHRYGQAWRTGLKDAAALEDVLGAAGAELVLHGHFHRAQLRWIEGAAWRVPLTWIKPVAERPLLDQAPGQAAPSTSAGLRCPRRQAVWRIGRHDLIATLQLGLVKRLVGAQQQFARIVAVVGERGDAQ